MGQTRFFTFRVEIERDQQFGPNGRRGDREEIERDLFSATNAHSVVELTAPNDIKTHFYVQRIRGFLSKQVK
jgi:hypothetical protein